MPVRECAVVPLGKALHDEFLAKQVMTASPELIETCETIQ